MDLLHGAKGITDIRADIPGGTTFAAFTDIFVKDCCFLWTISGKLEAVNFGMSVVHIHYPLSLDGVRAMHEYP